MRRIGISRREQAQTGVLPSLQVGSLPRDRPTESDIRHRCRAVERRSTWDPNRHPIRRRESVLRELKYATPGAILGAGEMDLAFGCLEMRSTGRSAHYGLDRSSENEPANKPER